MAEFFFDAEAIPQDTDKYKASKVPDGIYVCFITDSKIITTKATGDKSIVLELGVAKGEHTGAFFEVWCTIRSSANANKVKAGQRNLASFIKAAGKTQIKDTNELHDIPLVVTMTTKGKYQNLTAVKPYDGDDVQPQEKKSYNKDSELLF